MYVCMYIGKILASKIVSKDFSAGVPNGSTRQKNSRSSGRIFDLVGK